MVKKNNLFLYINKFSKKNLDGNLTYIWPTLFVFMFSKKATKIDEIFTVNVML